VRVSTVGTMPTATPTAGPLLREWRLRRRLSQLDLSLQAAVSARHLSFVETGRARPSRELVLHLADRLDVPLRERNALLLAAGYAPLYPATPLDADEMTPVRDALDRILAGHEPYPALIVDRRWDIVAANGAAGALIGSVDEELLRPTANALRLSLHPRGLAPRIANFGEWSAHLLTRLQRQAAIAGDPELTALHDELSALPGVEETHEPLASADLLFTPLRLRGETRELSFFSTISTFGTALDVTLAELSIEAFFPADAATAQALQEAA
jgi:transcriptional regulator with XRE-family HTH domain